ncbi:MAG: zf-HC2 domain-containing protein [Candidatus Eremiobacteraeota bacterium]|nr:zf-HC2 domain-containing protein [Candidatus Eremiobacteraeota bacterium]
MTQHLTTDNIIDYLHGELDPAEDALVHSHLQACAPCRAEFERESSLTDALRAYAHAEERDLPGMVKAQLWQTIRTQRPSAAERLAALLRPAIAVPAAALLVLVTYFASPLGRPTAQLRTIDVMYYFEQHAAEQMKSPLADRNATSSMLETSEAAFTGSTTLPVRAAAVMDAVR